MSEPLLKVENLYKHYPIRRQNTLTKYDQVKAVDGISFSVDEGETLGLVGESGCGKSTTRKLVLNLEPATRGNVFFRGEDIFSMKKKELIQFRKQAQVIYQDPYSSLNPTWKIGSIIAEAYNVHRIGTVKERREKVLALMDRVGLRQEYYDRYPHEFSGGQRQRIGIARSLALNPGFVVADEPVSALDVSIQAQVLNLLKELQEEFGLTYLFISHDLSVVKHLCDRIAVMYLGKIVEIAPTEQLFARTSHPYTQMLLKAIPFPDPDRRLELSALEGEVPSPINPPSGCRFHTRCPHVMEKCTQEIPQMVKIDSGHEVACYLYE
ncbi:MAG: dipeptide ABC transporter ATP-binding protein [Spirochaetaceae bacterium]|nr:dipeptide ABC transporter ATP-binding protein [Spirochaetaceae bacterium]MCF7948361.1 dipeptide ABC transporter ATP-binding protein [Spirochaetia bacterium]MCF7950826.1 dipeptide ABC transporter ATP-binding protein [Spirochaetaceae bacterium]